jgi:hypothetical protein
MRTSSSVVRTKKLVVGVGDSSGIQRKGNIPQLQLVKTENFMCAEVQRLVECADPWKYYIHL